MMYGEQGSTPPTVLIICFSDLARDPRVNRQIRFVSERYRVIAAGMEDPCVPGVDFVRIEWPVWPVPPQRSFTEEVAYQASRIPKIPRRIRRVTRTLLRRPSHYEQVYWNGSLVRDALPRLMNVRADVILANDPDTWPLALHLASAWGNGARVIFDAHEYSPREYDNLFLFRLVAGPYREYLCRQYIPRCDALITISRDFAELYRRDTGMDATVITNATDYDPALAPRLFGGDTVRPIRLVHHGLAAPVRRLEHFVDMMAVLPGPFEFTFMLMPSDAEYLARLKALAAGDPRVHFVDPVPMRDIPAFLNQFDVGVQLIEPENFNHLHCMPNKFFEWIQARLAIAVGPARELGSVVSDRQLGIVAPGYSPRSMARAIAATSREQWDLFKQNAHDHAEALSAQANAVILNDLIDRTLRGAPRARPLAAVAQPL